MLVGMPNQPKTPMHSFRVSDELWEAAKEKAKDEGGNLTEVLRQFLSTYVGTSGVS